MLLVTLVMPAAFICIDLDQPISPCCLLHCMSLLLALSGNSDCRNDCPLSGVKQTGRGHAAMFCPFRKFYPAWIRIVRQKHRITESDVCDPARAWNVRRRSVQADSST